MSNQKLEELLHEVRVSEGFTQTDDVIAYLIKLGTRYYSLRDQIKANPFPMDVMNRLSAMDYDHGELEQEYGLKSLQETEKKYILMDSEEFI